MSTGRPHKPLLHNRYPKAYLEKYNQNYEVFLKGMQLFGEFKEFIKTHVHRGDKMLDVGCGRGELLLFCSMLGAKCIGIDRSKADIKTTRKNLGRYVRDGSISVQLMDVGSLKFESNSFDLVIMMDIIEHLGPQDLDRSLSEAHRVLKSGGKLLIHTSPNRSNMQFIKFVAHFFGLKLTSDKYHINEQTPSGLEKLLKRNFFKISIMVIKDRNYFSGQMNKRGKLLKKISLIADTVYDSRLVEYFMKNKLFAEIFGTDIYAVCQK